ncbi:MAG: Maf family protein, partial [Clostridia bacterium]|nr:Maf family protein [Clostridia bacterium]
LSDEEIQRYIDSGEPFDKAGAYGIQGKASLFVTGIEGQYHNVVGFPVTSLELLLRKEFGMSLYDFT